MLSAGIRGERTTDFGEKRSIICAPVTSFVCVILSILKMIASLTPGMTLRSSFTTTSEVEKNVGSGT